MLQPARDIVFCGKQDGSITDFEVHTVTQHGVLYWHAVNIRTTCVSYSEQRSLLVSADESGCELIYLTWTIRLQVFSVKYV